MRHISIASIVSPGCLDLVMPLSSSSSSSRRRRRVVVVVVVASSSSQSSSSREGERDGREGGREGGMTVIHILIGMFNFFFIETFYS